MLLYLKVYLEFLVCKKSRKQTGVILLMILKVSVAIVLCLLICSEGILALSRSCSYELEWSSETKYFTHNEHFEHDVSNMQTVTFYF